jgi:hypothetical protein
MEVEESDGGYGLSTKLYIEEQHRSRSFGGAFEIRALLGFLLNTVELLRSSEVDASSTRRQTRA